MDKEFFYNKAKENLQNKWGHLYMDGKLMNPNNMPLEFANDLAKEELRLLKNYFFNKDKNNLETIESNKVLKEIYMLGFNHELKNHKIKFSPSQIISAYKIGKNHALLGDDGLDYAFSFESIIKNLI